MPEDVEPAWEEVAEPEWDMDDKSDRGGEPSPRKRSLDNTIKCVNTPLECNESSSFKVR
jgi:hypothetical protein